MRFKRTKENEKRIIEAYKRLGRYEDVAEEIGCSWNTVQRVMVKHQENPGQGNGYRVKDVGALYYHGGTPCKITDEELIEACKTMTRKEIAEKYGMHVESLPRRFRRLGISALKKSHEPWNKGIESEWHKTKAGEQKVKEYQGDRFEYIEHKGHKYRIRCKVCGSETIRDISTIKNYTVICEQCKENGKEEKKKQEQREKIVFVLRAIKEKKSPKTCDCCGETFFSEYPTKRYCSDKCRKKIRRRNKTNSIRRRARKYGVKYESGITLMKVAARDKGICKLCGKPVDWHDNLWGESYGPMYPTIDHKIALANGGNHEWDNVQLAHAICNSYKRDTA